MISSKMTTGHVKEPYGCLGIQAFTGKVKIKLLVKQLKSKVL